MLDNLLQLVKDFGENEVVNNPAIPNEHNNAVMGEAGMAVATTLQQALANGNVQEVLAMFQQGDADVMNSPLAQQAQGSFLDNITSKLGIDKGAAAGVASSLLPMIMNTLVKRTNSQAPEDSGFDLSSLIGSLTGAGQPGGQGGLDIGGLINQFTGQGGQGGSGGFDLNNIINQVKGGDNQGGGAGLGDLIQGFFGK